MTSTPALIDISIADRRVTGLPPRQGYTSRNPTSKEVINHYQAGCTLSDSGQTKHNVNFRNQNPNPTFHEKEG